MNLPALYGISGNSEQKAILNTDHRTANKDSVLILKIHGCYQDTQKFDQPCISIQAIQDENGAGYFVWPKLWSPFLIFFKAKNID